MQSKRLVLFILGLLVLPLPARAAIEVAPHKALYKMSMGKVKPGSNLQDVDGHMAFDWADVCDGWALQQHIRFTFSFADGSRSDIDSTMMTWEAKDGGAFTFYIRRLSGGVLDESFKGKAKLAETGGQAHFSMPSPEKEMSLPQGTLFPTAHTLMILEKAQAGEKLFTRKVFDGSSAEGVEEVSAFIAAPVDASDVQSLPESVRRDPLLSATAWPVRMAFYDPAQRVSEPDYEMEMTLQANGLARRIEIDYGDFSVIGTLEKVERNAPLACPAPPADVSP